MIIAPIEKLKTLPKMGSEGAKLYKANAPFKFHIKEQGAVWIPIEFDPKTELFYGLVQKYTEEFSVFSENDILKCTTLPWGTAEVIFSEFKDKKQVFDYSFRE